MAWFGSMCRWGDGVGISCQAELQFHITFPIPFFSSCCLIHCFFMFLFSNASLWQWAKVNGVWSWQAVHAAGGVHVKLPYDCHAGLKNWHIGWSAPKKAWKGCGNDFRAFVCCISILNLQHGHLCSVLAFTGLVLQPQSAGLWRWSRRKCWCHGTSVKSLDTDLKLLTPKAWRIRCRRRWRCRWRWRCWWRCRRELPCFRRKLAFFGRKLPFRRKLPFHWQLPHPPCGSPLPLSMLIGFNLASWLHLSKVFVALTWQIVCVLGSHVTFFLGAGVVHMTYHYADWRLTTTQYDLMT